MALEDTINREPLSDLFRRMRADYDSGKYFEDARGAIPVTDGFRIPNGAKKRLSDAEAKVIGVYGDAGSIAERINAYLHQTKNFFFSRILRKRIDESLLERISRDVKELGYANAEIIPAIKQGERARDSLAEQNRGLWLGMAELAEKKLFAEKAYDKLVEELGGKPAPAAGMALGIERSVSALKQYYEQNQIKPPAVKCDAYMAQLGEQAKRRILKIINELRSVGLKLSYNFSKNSLKAQLESANGLQVPYALILGQKEVQDGTIIVRDMESGVQEIIDQKKIENILKKKLGKV